MALTLGALVLLAAALVGLGVILARKAATWTIRRDERVLSRDGDRLTFSRTPESAHAGTFVLHFDGGAVQVGEVLEATDRTVTRRILRSTGNLDGLHATSSVRWEGETHFDAIEAGDHDEVVVESAAGPCPAWLYPGPVDARPTAWAIHIHGIRAGRDNAVRSVAAATEAGLSSLVISYRGDPEGPKAKGRAASLGITEWVDADAAVQYALDHGAERVVLIGWSMGASIALQVAERSEHRALIAGLILISPATDWRSIIQHGARSRGLPPAAAALGELTLTHPWLSKVAGLAAPADFDSLDWTIPGRLGTPTLVIHSRGDRTVPYELTERFKAAGGELVTLHEASGADHSWEFNVDPDGFIDVAKAWLKDRLSSD